LGPGREAVAGLMQRPWPAASRALSGSGVEYLYISDVRLSRDDESCTRHRFRQDARFEEVLEGGDDSLFRIRWDTELPHPADSSEDTTKP